LLSLCLPFEQTAPNPYPQPLDLAEQLDSVHDTLRRHIVADSEVFVAATLWSAMTYMMDYFDIAPILVITAPEPRCGKSEFKRVLGRLVYHPMLADNITPAVMFRTIDLWHPTLLIDEYDTFIKGNEELRGVLNAGHERGSRIMRCVGDDHNPVSFDVFGPKVLAGIGSLPATIIDRSIVLQLRRKLPHETVVRLRVVPRDYFVELQAKLARIALDYGKEISTARLPLPEALSDRAQDNWEPLLQIAHVAGGHWPETATAAALKLSRTTEDGQTTGVQLLSDMHEIFAAKRVDRLSSHDLIAELCADDEKRWATYNRGFPITPTQIAKRLREYGILSKTIRTGGGTLKGYNLDQFKDAFARYVFGTLSEASPDVTPAPTKSTEHSCVPAAQRSSADAVTDVAADMPQVDAAVSSGAALAPNGHGDVTLESRQDGARDGVTAGAEEEGFPSRTPDQEIALTAFKDLLVQERQNSFINDQGQLDFDTTDRFSEAIQYDMAVTHIAKALRNVNSRLRNVKARQLVTQLVGRVDLLCIDGMLSVATEEDKLLARAAADGTGSGAVAPADDGCIDTPAASEGN